MATVVETQSPPQTVADLVHRLGDVPLERIRMQPPLGTATEADLIGFNDRKQGLCELVDGILVEKPMGYPESRLAAVLIGYFEIFFREHDIGIVSGPDGPTRLAPGKVREPDVSVVRRDRLPNGKSPREAISPVAPDLAVEVLSPGNTKREMDRKLHEYFEAGVRLVWMVDSTTMTVRVHTSEKTSSLLGADDVLDGGDVLPGFQLSIREWFERAE